MSESVNSGLFKLTLALVSLLVVVIILIGFVEPMASLDFTEQINILLAFAITFFALIEALSTYMQVLDNRRQIRFQHLQNELENCYGPLHSILYKHDAYQYNLEQYEYEAYYAYDYEEKAKIEKIFEHYPHLLPLNLYYDWKLGIGFNKKVDGSIEVQHVVVSLIVDLYDAIVKEYQKFINMPS